MTGSHPLLPRPDRDSAPWWDGLARHELLVQRCDGCGARRWPPRAMCNRCGGLTWEWEQASGGGEVMSWIVNRHPFSDAFTAPYVVVLVRLDEQDDILVPGAWAGPPDGTGLRVGLPVVAGFDDVDDVVAGADGRAVTLLRWCAADPGRAGDAASTGPRTHR